ncbi:response regulator transcription factor [Humibacter albus]|uniref:response regulator transcription factor n=1 Tax=Humibacter albus TaxID=427754 RepID=UPI000A055B3F
MVPTSALTRMPTVHSTSGQGGARRPRHNATSTTSIPSWPAISRIQATSLAAAQFVHRAPPHGDDRGPLAVLTARECEVLVEIARGCTNQELGDRLHMAEGTVKTHVSRILFKLGLRDRVQAVIAAYEFGLIEPAGGVG